jgi:hypothetical protein
MAWSTFCRIPVVDCHGDRVSWDFGRRRWVLRILAFFSHLGSPEDNAGFLLLQVVMIF